MNKMQLQVLQFMHVMGAKHRISTLPREPNPLDMFGDPIQLPRADPGLAEDPMLQIRLIDEEVKELFNAIEEENLVEIADAMGDIIYVVMHCANAYGIDLEPIYDEIQRSNMAKVGSDGKVTRNANNKVMKPEGWMPPDIKGELLKQGWTGSNG